MALERKNSPLLGVGVWPMVDLSTKMFFFYKASLMSMATTPGGVI